MKKSYLMCEEITNFQIFTQPIPIFFFKVQNWDSQSGAETAAWKKTIRKFVISSHAAKYKKDSYFPLIFQSNMSVCLIISVFCKSFEPKCEPEITPVLYHLENQKQFYVQRSIHKSYKTRT